MNKIFTVVISCSLVILLNSMCSTTIKTKKANGELKLPVSFKGITGQIEVKKFGDEIVLLVNGVVQGRKKMNGSIDLPDPLAQLVPATYLNPAKVLLIGLGTGKTAMDIQKMGILVDAVEIEPQIIELARKYFGYMGKAIAADGVDYIKSTWKKYDLIIIDAFKGLSFPENLISDEAVKNYKRILTPNGRILLRVFMDPMGVPLQILIEKFGGVEHSILTQYPVSGKQFLYVTIGTSNINSKIGIPLFPLTYIEKDWKEYHDFIKLRSPKTLYGTITGYAIKYGKDKTLCIDLPHLGMGATRFILKGKTELLQKKLKGLKLFPSHGDLSSDDKSHQSTPEIIPQGGSKGSEGRSSGVVATVTGKFKLVSIGPPYHSMHKPDAGEHKFHPVLPYGGFLYEMLVDSVDMILTSEQWQKCGDKVEANPKFFKKYLKLDIDTVMKLCAEGKLK